jgi:hypothetical protein
VSADSTGAAIAADRASTPIRVTPSAAERGARALDGDPVRVAIVGATGYVGAELIRLLARHPNVTISGLVGRERHGDPIEGFHRARDHRAGGFDEVPDGAEAALALPTGRSRRGSTSSSTRPSSIST